jgi:hypothetical protein
MSSKFSGRRSTARKPPICISKPPIIIITTIKLIAHITWSAEENGSGAIAIDESHELLRDPEPSNTYRFANPDPGPGDLVSITVNAPNDATFNYALIGANDSRMQLHAKETWWEPAQPPPFIITLTEWIAYDFPDDVISLNLHN